MATRRASRRSRASGNTFGRTRAQPSRYETIAAAARRELPGQSNAGLRKEIRDTYAAWERSEYSGDVDGVRALLSIGRRVALSPSGKAALARVARAAYYDT